MKKIIITLSILLVTNLLIALFLFKPSIFNIKDDQNSCNEIVDRKTIVIKNGKYEPQNINIKKCTQITFRNDDSLTHWPASDIHPTHGIYPEFDSLEEIEPGNEWTFVFNKIGSWRYHDHLYPNLRGIIKVTE